MLLHRITEHMRVTHQPETFFTDLCQDLKAVMDVEKLLVLLGPGKDETSEVRLAASIGNPRLAGSDVSLLWQRTMNDADSRTGVLIDSHLEPAFWNRWPLWIKNLLGVPIKYQEVNHGALIAINKRNRPDFDSTDAKLMLSLASAGAAYLENFHLYRDLQDLMLGSLKALTSSIDAKDPYTCGHSERVALISRWLAQKSGLPHREIYDCYLGGLLHDVGKIGVSEAILCKPGKLTEHEFVEIRKHPEIGANILRGLKQLAEVNRAVLTHHERLDGSGYPRQLAGSQIPKIGRIVGLADSFDAMVSDRLYRAALSTEEALSEVGKSRGRHFDPPLVDILQNEDIRPLLGQLKEVCSNPGGNTQWVRAFHLN